MQNIDSSEWSGSIFIWRKRVLFVGEAGTSEDQKVHAIKVCVALSGDFELSLDSGVKGKRFSAVIINAGIKHTVRCNREEIFLLYLLPETDEAINLRQEYLNNGKSGVYDIPRELIKKSLPLKVMTRHHLKRECTKASKVCDRVIRGLGKIRHKQLTTSRDLGGGLNDNVRKVINYIYDNIYFETDLRQGSQRIKKEQFEPTAIGSKLGLSKEKMSKVEAHFMKKEEVGISIEHFVREIQLLSALRQYAIEEEKSMHKEPHLKEIAQLLDITQPDLCHRISTMLGINHSNLKGGSTFYACNETDET